MKWFFKRIWSNCEKSWRQWKNRKIWTENFFQQRNFMIFIKRNHFISLILKTLTLISKSSILNIIYLEFFSFCFKVFQVLSSLTPSVQAMFKFNNLREPFRDWGRLISDVKPQEGGVQSIWNLQQEWGDIHLDFFMTFFVNSPTIVNILNVWTASFLKKTLVLNKRFSLK